MFSQLFDLALRVFNNFTAFAKNMYNILFTDIVEGVALIDGIFVFFVSFLIARIILNFVD